MKRSQGGKELTGKTDELTENTYCKLAYWNSFY